MGKATTKRFIDSTAEEKDKQSKDPSKVELISELSWASSSYYDKYLMRPYNPDELVRQKGGLTIYDQMREDEQIKALLAVKKHCIMGSGWELKPASPSSADVEIKEFVEYNLCEVLDNFDRNIWEILSCLDYGFSLHEKIYAIDGGKYLIKEFKHRAPHTFEFHTDTKGNLPPDGFRQWGSEGLKPLPLDKFVYAVYQREFDSWYGKSDLRSCYKSWFTKDLVTKFWVMYLERFGSPFTVGSYDAGKITGEALTALKSIIKNIQQTTAIAIPKDIEIDLKESIGRGPDQYDKAIDKFNINMARALLIPDLLGFSKPIEGGSFALGDKHFQIFMKIIASIQKDIQNVIKRQVLKPLVDLNFNTKTYPTFVFKPILEDDKKEYARIFLDAVSKGVVNVSVEDKNYLRDMLTFPEEDESLEGDAKEKELEQENEDTTETDDLMEGDVAEKEKKDMKHYSKRELNAFELRADFKKIGEQLKSGEDKMKVALSEVFKDIVFGLTEVIIAKNIVPEKKTDEIEKLQIPDLGRLKTVLQRYFYDSYRTGNLDAEKTLENANKKVNKRNYEAWLLPEEALNFFKEKAFYITGVEKENILKKAKATLYSAIKNGTPISEVVKSLDKISKDYDFDGGRTETIARTNLMEAYNTGLLHTYEDPALNDFVKAYQVSAVLDDRTTPLCESLDGNIYDVDDPIWNTLSFPAHFNCRTILIPITEVDEYKATEEHPKMEETGGGFLKLSDKEYKRQYELQQDAYIVVQLKDDSDFDSGTLQPFDMDVSKEIRSVIGRVKGTMDMAIKEIYFSKSFWTMPMVNEWLASKGYIPLPSKDVLPEAVI